MKKKWRSWLLMAVPYLLIAILPVISVLFLGRTVQRNYQEKVIAEKQSSIQASFDRMLQNIETVENLSYMLSTNHLLERYSYACLNHSGHSQPELMEIKDLLAGTKSNPLIHEVFLFDPRDNSVVSTNTAVSKMWAFFRFSYMINGLSVEESIARLSSLPKTHKYCPSVTLTFSDTPEVSREIVEYRIFLPVGWVGTMHSQLIIAMDARQLFSGFRDALPGGEFYVYDSNGVLIYSIGNQYGDLLPLSESASLHPIGGSDSTLYGASLHSPDGKWTVKVFIPELLGKGGMSFQSPAIWGFVVSPAVVSVLLTIFFTHKNYRRILELLELFKGHIDERENRNRRKIVDYRLIQEYTGEVISEKNRAIQKVNEYAYSRKYEVLDKLLRSTYRSPEEAAQALAETNLNIRPRNNTVLCICCPGDPHATVGSEGVTVRDMVRQLLRDLLENPYELFDSSLREIICVISLAEEESLELLIQDIVSHLNVKIAYHFGIEVLIGAGNPADQIGQLGESYEQARTVLRYRELSGNHVNLYSQLVQLEDLYFYPREYDEKILNYVVAEKKEEAIRLIQEIYEENFVKNRAMLSLRAIDAIQSRLWDCVSGMAEKYGIPLESVIPKGRGPTVLQIRSETNARRYFSLICEIIDLLAERIRSKKSNVQNSLAKKIMDHVQENFCNQELSLKHISLALGIHENYISNLFKNAYGENLSTYIENLRIEKACSLIRTTSMKIEEIAQVVGYASAGNFRRAFKKIKGTSPTEYREQ